MRVLFDHSTPFALTHGGFQTQIEQTRSALQQAGVEVEYLRWWDQAQRGDIIHFFGRASEFYIQMAQKKGCKVVMAELLTETGSRSRLARLAQRGAIQLARRLLPASFRTRMAWECYRRADALVALTSWEARMMTELFQAPPERVHVIPNGVEEVFFRTHAPQPDPWLVCTATITERKRVVELARAAVPAQTPVWVIGKPYHEQDPYYIELQHLAQAHASVVRYEGGISDRARLADIYQRARGFVLLSAMESLSLSALEAAAAGCPLLLSDLPWARSSFGNQASYCPLSPSVQKTAAVLREFYDGLPRLSPPSSPKRWSEIGLQLKSLYESIMP